MPFTYSVSEMMSNEGMMDDSMYMEGMDPMGDSMETGSAKIVSPFLFLFIPVTVVIIAGIVVFVIVSKKKKKAKEQMLLNELNRFDEEE